MTRDVLIFLAGSTFGSLVTTIAICLCMMRARAGDQRLDGQQQWRADVKRLLQE